ncbi:conserved hypothetical protein, partial [Ricinus communis]
MQRQMLVGVAFGAEDIVLEHRLPGLAMGRRQGAQGEHGVQEGVAGQASPLVGRVPPVVHQHVDRLQRADVVPPQVWYVDRVAGFQLRGLGDFQGPGEARELLKVGVFERDEADGRSGRRPLEWAHVEVLHLIGREQSEAASSSDNTGDVLERVVVGGDDDTIADPDPGFDLGAEHRQGIILGEAGEGVPGRNRLGGQGRLFGVARMFGQEVEGLLEAGASASEIHAREIIVVEEASARFGRSEDRADRLAGVETRKIVEKRRV